MITTDFMFVMEDDMKDQNKKAKSWIRRANLAIMAAGVMVSVCCMQGAFAGQAGQMSFVSPGKAVASLVSAVKANDLQKLSAILGEGSKELISSGDDVADTKGRAKFIEATLRQIPWKAKANQNKFFCLAMRSGLFLSRS